MKLLTEEIRSRLPASEDRETPLSDLIIHVKFFTPDSGWTWYVASGEPFGENGHDFVFFGFVVGPFPEWGPFLLSELEAVRGPFGLPVERDLHFKPGKASDVIREL